MLCRDQVEAWIRAFAGAIADQKEYLTQLDTAIGDADHGTNLDRGFRKVLERLDDWRQGGIGKLLQEVGMTLIATVGGASGPLYGTFFVRAAAAAGSGESLIDAEAAEMFSQGVDGVAQRGRAELGDKTMVDVLVPARDAWMAATKEGTSLAEAVERAVGVAAEARDATGPMLARRGRASYLGERSRGHIDPGAASAHLMLQSLMLTIEREDS
ncbi:PTS-dependent dihydroxyacetone kinase, ADP-binding subunit DhaL [Planctomycetes bacterium Pan216]|uniref:PTS-dependent dihydroxyacetone kinase, ADP-binding subunit DhaL n=1 Tax=Kolteria novifilia TaxID=2527975 RepID=A0A518BC45_9BACT|nr:PTS-dependent dihydroxyacetone kinase, ADP-binding subunit DhaL [Planctomycetes bacterium Pan216]